MSLSVEFQIPSCTPVLVRLQTSNQTSLYVQDQISEYVTLNILFLTGHVSVLLPSPQGSETTADPGPTHPATAARIDPVGQHDTK